MASGGGKYRKQVQEASTGGKWSRQVEETSTGGKYRASPLVMQKKLEDEKLVICTNVLGPWELVTVHQGMNYVPGTLKTLPCKMMSKNSFDMAQLLCGHTVAK